MIVTLSDCTGLGDRQARQLVARTEEQSLLPLQRVTRSRRNWGTSPLAESGRSYWSKSRTIKPRNRLFGFSMESGQPRPFGFV